MPVACNSSGFYMRVVRAPARAVEHGMKIDTRRLGSPRTGQGVQKWAGPITRRPYNIKASYLPYSTWMDAEPVPLWLAVRCSRTSVPPLREEP